MKKIYLLFFATVIFLIFFGCGQHQKSNSRYKLLIGWGMTEFGNIDFDSLLLNDPFVYADEDTRTYYITGSGGKMWKSTDLKSWLGPYSYIEIDTTSWMGSDPMIWSPELYKYNNKYYCFTTFTNVNTIVDTVPNRYNVQRRASHILVADKPEGPYRPISENDYLPEKWSTLDGTFWIENGQPYMVFSHEWMQVVDGTMNYVQLSSDLSRSVGKTVELFKASDAAWSKEMKSIGEITYGMSLDGYVTDGPFVFKTETGRMGMLWSSWSTKRYAQGVAYSESGKLAGPWIQQEKPLVAKNSGHGMLFKTFDGKPILLMHYQSLEENPGPKKPIMYEVDLSGNELKVLKKYNP